jgi:MoxR-like ATPase
VLKVESHVVHDEHFANLLHFGMHSECQELQPYADSSGLDGSDKNAAAAECTYDDFQLAQQHIFNSFSTAEDAAHVEAPNSNDDWISLFQRVIQRLIREDRIYVSDRKIIKLNKLIRTRAWLFGGGTVRLDDLALLRYIGDSAEEMAVVRQKVPILLEQ